MVVFCYSGTLHHFYLFSVSYFCTTLPCIQSHNHTHSNPPLVVVVESDLILRFLDKFYRPPIWLVDLFNFALVRSIKRNQFARRKYPAQWPYLYEEWFFSCIFSLFIWYHLISINRQFSLQISVQKKADLHSSKNKQTKTKWVMR